MGRKWIIEEIPLPLILYIQGKALLGKLLPRLERERYSSTKGKGTALEHAVELQTLVNSYKVERTEQN